MIVLLQRLGWFVGLVLLQVLVLNHVHILGYGTPFVFIYFILKYNSSVSRNVLMLWAFALGLTVDIFSNTPGMNAAALTLLAFVRGSLLRLVSLRDSADDYEPGIRTLGVAAYFRYLLLAVTLFCAVLLLIDAFSLFHLPVLLLKIVTATAATILCIWCIEVVRKKK